MKKTDTVVFEKLNNTELNSLRTITFFRVNVEVVERNRTSAKEIVNNIVPVFEMESEGKVLSGISKFWQRSHRACA